MKTGKMNPKKIILGENHRRSLTSSLTIVEQLLIEIEDSLINKPKVCCNELVNDVSNENIIHDLEVINAAREQICNLAAKYSINRRKQSLQRVLDAKKTKIWEVLCNSKAKRQRGFGEFPKELVQEYDNDIDSLLTIAERIKF